MNASITLDIWHLLIFGTVVYKMIGFFYARSMYQRLSNWTYEEKERYGKDKVNYDIHKKRYIGSFNIVMLSAMTMYCWPIAAAWDSVVFSLSYKNEIKA